MDRVTPDPGLPVLDQGTTRPRATGVAGSFSSNIEKEVGEVVEGEKGAPIGQRSSHRRPHRGQVDFHRRAPAAARWGGGGGGARREGGGAAQVVPQERRGGLRKKSVFSLPSLAGSVFYARQPT